MDGWGTDEGTLIRLLCPKTPSQMAVLRARHIELYDAKLMTRVKGETGGALEDILLGFLKKVHVGTCWSSAR